MIKILWIFTSNHHYRGWTNGIIQLTDEYYFKRGHEKTAYDLCEFDSDLAFLHENEFLYTWNHTEIKLRLALPWKPLTPEQLLLLLNGDKTYEEIIKTE